MRNAAASSTILALLAACSHAPDPSSPEQPQADITSGRRVPTGGAAGFAAFTRADANRDGFIDRSEFARGGTVASTGGGAPDAMFDMHDTNKDGRLTEAELNHQDAMPGASAIAQLADAQMKRDADGDGKLTFAEFSTLPPGARIVSTSTPERMFEIYDANKDGFLTRAELEGFAKGQVTGGARIISGGVAAPTLDQRKAAFTTSDKDSDGKLSQAEYQSALKQLGIAGALEAQGPSRDANKDGFISLDEFTASMVVKLGGRAGQP